MAISPLIQGQGLGIKDGSHSVLSPSFSTDTDMYYNVISIYLESYDIFEVKSSDILYRYLTRHLLAGLSTQS